MGARIALQPDQINKPRCDIYVYNAEFCTVRARHDLSDLQGIECRVACADIRRRCRIRAKLQTKPDCIAIINQCRRNDGEGVGTICQPSHRQCNTDTTTLCDRTYIANESNGHNLRTIQRCHDSFKTCDVNASPYGDGCRDCTAHFQSCQTALRIETELING